MRQHFGIGFRGELDPFALKLLLEREVIFQHAVMHDGKVAGTAGMRVGIGIGGPSVRGPAGVADAIGSGAGFVLDRLGQLGNSTSAFTQMKLVPSAGDETGAVVASVFEAFQAVKQDRRRFGLTREPYDSAHAFASPW